MGILPIRYASRVKSAKVISVTDDGLHATLRRVTHGLGTFQLDIAAILSGQKWQLTVHPR